jgi:hypothetical protein
MRASDEDGVGSDGHSIVHSPQSPEDEDARGAAEEWGLYLPSRRRRLSLRDGGRVSGAPYPSKPRRASSQSRWARPCR